MTHIWMRAESRPHEARAALMPEGAAALIAAGIAVTVEDSRQRAVPLADYAAAGCAIVPAGAWTAAPAEVFVLGVKELPEAATPLRHRHIMFGHAYKGQAAGRVLLERLKAGGGMLYDLEYLTDAEGRRLAAFGYWAGFAGAAVSVLALAAQWKGAICPPVGVYAGSEAMLAELETALASAPQPRPGALVIGALGRVGHGAAALCEALGIAVTRWDIAETAHGGPFPEVLAHELVFNAILARPGCPVFVPAETVSAPRLLRVIGDIACDPRSDFSPIKVYHRETSWDAPVIRVAEAPPLDVMAIDNLPALLPRESSADFAAQLLPVLFELARPEAGAWGRAAALYRQHA